MAGVVRKVYENKALKLGHNIVMDGVATAAVKYGDILEYDPTADKWKASTGAGTGALGVSETKAKAGEGIAVIVAGVISEAGLSAKLTNEIKGKLMTSGVYVAMLAK